MLGDIMRVRLLRTYALPDGYRPAGDVVEVPDYMAADMLGMGAAERAEALAPEYPRADPAPERADAPPVARGVARVPVRRGRHAADDTAA